MSQTWLPIGKGNDGGDILYNVMVQLAEFTIGSGSSVTCAIINGGVNVSIGNGSGNDSMIATILVIDRTLFDNDAGAQAYKFTLNGSNMIASTDNIADVLRLLHVSNLVLGGQIPLTSNIGSSGLPKINRPTTQQVSMNDIRVPLSPGTYSVIAYLGVSTDDAVNVTLVSGSKVTFGNSCADPILSSKTVVPLGLTPMSQKWLPSGVTGNDGGAILHHVVVKLGEFTLQSGSSSGPTCATINGGVQVGIGDGSGSDSMTASILVINKALFDGDINGGVRYPFSNVNGNMISHGDQTADYYDLFNLQNLVVAGKHIASNTIATANLIVPYIKRDSKMYPISMNNVTVAPGPGTYWVVAYLGISTDDAVLVNILPNSQVTFPDACITPLPQPVSLNKFNNMSYKLAPTVTGNVGGTIQFNYLFELGEFTVPPLSSAASTTTCTVNIDAGYQVQITDGSGLDSMIATLLVIDKTKWDASSISKNWAWISQTYGSVTNTVAYTSDTTNMITLLRYNNDKVVVAGTVPQSPAITDSTLPQILRNNVQNVTLTNNNLNLPPGFYYVVGYLGIATNDTISIQKLTTSSNTVTLTGACSYNA
jgi:hypothetical protein